MPKIEIVSLPSRSRQINRGVFALRTNHKLRVYIRKRSYVGDEHDFSFAYWRMHGARERANNNFG